MNNKIKNVIMGAGTVFTIVGALYFNVFSPSLQNTEKVVETKAVANSTPNIEYTDVGTTKAATIDYSDQLQIKTQPVLKCKHGVYIMYKIRSEILVIHPDWFLVQRHDNKHYQIFISLKDSNETKLITQRKKPNLCNYF